MFLGYGLSPMVAYQMIWFSRSSWPLSIFANIGEEESWVYFFAFPVKPLAGLFNSSSGILFWIAVYGARLILLVKQSNMGRAVASITFIGGMPRICSMVRTIQVWL